jgi:hypothetical protein
MGAYEQLPAEQVPEGLNILLVDAPAQDAEGGEVQVRPAHGSALQRPSRQPYAHCSFLSSLLPHESNQ